jgi:hypothetical protein
VAPLSPASRCRAAAVPALLAGLTVARMLRAGAGDLVWPWAVVLVVAVATVVFLLWPGAARRR